MINITIHVGRIVKDHELKHTNNGKPVVNFTLAVNRNYTNAQGEREADFIDFVAFGKLAEIINQYTGKGSLISVEGTLQTRYYEHNTGIKIKVCEIIASNVVFLDTKKNDQPPF